MKEMGVYGFCILISIICSYAQINPASQAWTATMDYSTPSMGSGAIEVTSFSYDWNQYSYYFVFGSYSALYSYNTYHGENPKIPVPYISQESFYVSSACCEADALDNSMPRLFWDPSSYVAAGAAVTIPLSGLTCYPYKPVSTYTTTPVTTIWFSTNDNKAVVCKVLFNDNTNYTFSNVRTGATIQASTFAQPTNCGCSKPIDVSLVLDRTGSIHFWMWNDMYTFLQNFGSEFTWSPTAANLDLVQFNTFAWGSWQNGAYSAPPKLSLVQGSSQTAVTNTLSSMACCNTYNGNPNASCCDGWTSISSGLRAGVDQLALSARPYATKILLLVTDGKQNTLYDPSNKDPLNGDTCYDYCCQYSLQGSLCPDYQTAPGCQYYYCIGDTNADGIPDDWLPPSQTSKPPLACNNPPANQHSLKKCQQDLIDAREYGYQKIGTNLIVYSVGVGTVPLMSELELIANDRFKRPAGVAPVSPITWTPTYNPLDDDHPERVVNTTDWNSFSSIVSLLVSTVCNENQSPCGTCCGVCVCGTCVPPTKCLSTNFCQTGVLQGGCCTTTPTVCPSTPCTTGVCDPVKQNCTSTPVKCQPADTCYNYTCIAPNGCTQVLLGPQPTNLCESSYCDTTTNPPTLVSLKQKVCTQLDACHNYYCNTTTGECSNTPIPVPTSTNLCISYFCDPKNFTTPIQTKTVICTAPNKCSSSVCNPSTGQCVLTNKVCNNPSNLCDISQCNMADGTCPTTPTLTNCPATLPNDACVSGGFCNTTTGLCQYNPPKVCTPTDCHNVICNSTTGNCQTLTTGCELICQNTNCSSKNNQCFQFQCDGSAGGPNCNIVINLANQYCTQAATDHCVTYTRCDNATGCVYTPVVCPDKPCKVLTRNSSNSQCCQYTDLNCNFGDPCQVYSCNQATGNCTQTPLCNLASDACVQRTCTNGVCSTTTTNCTTTDPCNPVTGCDPVLGCKFSPIKCNDNNNCTTDSCSNGVCSFVPVVCTAPDPCTTAVCNTNSPTGACIFTPKVCTAPNNCTSSSCNTTTGKCDVVTLNETLICDDGNVCTIDTCSSSIGKCVHTPVVCPPTNGTCTTLQCVPGYGCVSTFITCVIDENGDSVVSLANHTYPKPKDCTIAYCANQTCVKDVQICAGLVNTNAVIIGSALGAAAIAGIVCAAVAFAAISAGSGYAVYSAAGLGGFTLTSNNPLYTESGNKGVNPLYHE